MSELIAKRIFEIYKRLLEIHILTKTTDKNWFHSDTATAYEWAFSLFHKVEELKQDLEIDEPVEVEEVSQEAYDLVEELKWIVQTMVKDNKDIAMDELLRGEALGLTSICWDLKKHLLKDKDTD